MLMPLPLLACDEGVPCDKCAKASEYSWNPDNRYVTDRLKRFYSLDEQIAAAYAANEFDRAKKLARESLKLAAIYRCNWNYGNAIHDSNRILGLVSLRSGDVEVAVKYLLKAGKSTGSPQLNTFGPQLDLANELLKLGKVDAVKTYLKDIQSFWEMDEGKVDAWLASIDKGERPKLSSFPQMGASVLVRFVNWLIMLWPAIVSIGFLYIQRKRIRKKPLFLITSVAAGYAALYGLYWISDYAFKTIVEMENVGTTVFYVLVFLPLGLALLLPILIAFGVGRILSNYVSGDP